MSKIVDSFVDVCNAKKHMTAIIYEKNGVLISKTFLQLRNDVSATVAYLAENNVRQGDRILAFSSSSYQLCVFMWASLIVGASIMYVDIFAKQKRLRKVFEEYTPDMILVSNKTKYLRFFFKEIAGIKKVINTDSVRRTFAKCLDFPNTEIPEETTALLTMTTGSTGEAKVALRNHSDLMQQLQLIRENVVLSDDGEVALTTSYIYIFANILCGITTVLPQLNLKKSAETINRKLSIFKELPITMAITTPDFCLKADNVFPKLKKLYFGGAILNLYEAKLIQSKYSYSDNTIIYGSTECCIMCMVNLKEFTELLKETHCAPLGYAIKGVSIRLTDENEIIVHSDALLEKYLTEDKSTKTNDENGILWHHTNDMATKKGSVYFFSGKSKYYITIQGNKIYSNEIEQKLVAVLKDVSKCAVLQQKEKVYVFLENGSKHLLNEAKSILRKTYNITDVKTVSIKKIPCDKKHHTKIDYEKLKKRI